MLRYKSPRIRLLRRSVYAIAKMGLAVFVWLHLAGVGWAQEGEEAAGGDGKNYVLMYLLVVLVVGLGLTVVLRPSGRLKEVRRG